MNSQSKEIYTDAGNGTKMKNLFQNIYSLLKLSNSKFYRGISVKLKNSILLGPWLTIRKTSFGYKSTGNIQIELQNISKILILWKCISGETLMAISTPRHTARRFVMVLGWKSH